MCGASGCRPASVEEAVTSWAFTLVAPVACVTSKPRLVVLFSRTSAADNESLCAVTVHVERPVMTRIELGSQLCDRVTIPCCLLNATGRCSARGPPSWVRLMRPKYWPFAAAGAEIVIFRSTVRPGCTANTAGLTEIDVPAGSWALAANPRGRLVTFVAVIVVGMTPGMLG